MPAGDALMVRLADNVPGRSDRGRAASFGQETCMLELPLWLWLVFAGVLGLLVGSFLNVVILRLPARLEAQWRREAQEELALEAVDEPLPPGIVREPSH